MTWLEWSSLVVAGALVVYLTYALLRGERM